MKKYFVNFFLLIFFIRDEKLAAAIGISSQEIDRVVSMPMDEFQVKMINFKDFL